MKIKRTYKPTSKNSGTTEIVDEAKAREVFGQTDVAFHKEGECGTKLCHYCAEPALRRLKAGAVVETFFSRWELVEA